MSNTKKKRSRKWRKRKSHMNRLKILKRARKKKKR